MSLTAQFLNSFSFGFSKKEKVSVPPKEVAGIQLRRRTQTNFARPRPSIEPLAPNENFTQSNDDFLMRNRSMSMRRPKPKLIPSKPRSIIFVGEGYSGRTSLMDRVEQKFRLSQTEKECYHHEENGVAYSKLVSESQTLILLDMEDITSYKSHHTSFYDSIDMFVVCFDLSNESAFDNVYTQWIKGIKENHPNTSFVVVGCKSDIDKQKRVVSVSPKGKKNSKIESLETTALELGASAYIECSSWMIINIGKVYEAVTGVPLTQSKSSPEPIRRRPSQRVPQRLVGSIRTSFRRK